MEKYIQFSLIALFLISSFKYTNTEECTKSGISETDCKANKTCQWTATGTCAGADACKSKTEETACTDTSTGCKYTAAGTDPTTNPATTTVQTTVVTTTSAPVTTAAPSTPITWETAKLGDVDLDDMVDSTDASEILGLYAALNTGSTAEDFDPGFIAASDVDNNGTTDATDASFVLQYYSYTQTGGKGTMEEFMKNENGM